MSESAIEVKVLEDIGQINLRGDATDDAFLAAVQSVIGCELPLLPNTVTDGATRACWLGPNEWLLTATAAEVGAMRLPLEQALQSQHVAVNDLSGGQLLLRLTGDPVRSLLAKGCTLDLHPDVFEAGACAQTGLAKAAVVILSHQSGPGVDLIVRRSFADYLLQWLQRAGAEYKIEFA